MVWPIIRWSTLRTPMSKRTRAGRERTFRPKPNGSTPRVVALDNAVYAWGNEFLPNGRFMANTWQGRFPYENLRDDGFEGTSPVDAFPPNGYGVRDMIGNVWEWTADWYRTSHVAGAKRLLWPECRRREHRSLSPGNSHPAQSPEGWLAPLRAELLPSLSSRGAISTAHRYVDQSRRLPTDRAPFVHS